MSVYPSAALKIEDSKIFAALDEPLFQKKFDIGKYTYYFSPADNNTYVIKRLSNTRNMNVIFSIKLKRTQDAQDLSEFEADLED